MDRNDWVEDLPEGCPPNDAYKPTDLVVYRVVSEFPPRESDFLSHKALHPERAYIPECEYRAVSVCDNIEHAKSLLYLPSIRKKGGEFIVKLILLRGSGVIKPGKDDKSHINWWRRKCFDPIQASTLMA